MWVLRMELASIHLSGAQNGQATIKLFENFCTYYYYYYCSRVGYNA